ncbi:Na+/H+ antiporter NhaA [Nocardioides sp. WG-D5]|uniref:Na+/H+ antiporter NhaA n=1 Tax=Nocardioides luteus TaxID=1844 RepID=UPI00020285A3|nr:Na+/H+ antiporter NhaA [Nocardioides luteus]EGD44551.1 Na+/H+ antiporter NhaA [Nocardioidaceae bacterium Broad-1]MBG6098926.1 NhaA family Na+:H+ antiporter [Nocardioides luteus]
MTDTRNRLFTRGSWLETSRTAEILRAETTGGILLIIAAVIAVVLANSPLQDAYEALRDFRVGPAALHLDLSIGAWAADGLLAIFFFVAGLELKREFVSGDLRDPRRAALPIAAAVGGMVVPALVYVAVNVIGDGSLAGWATPVATDIAFAVAILAVISTHLPAGLRTFLLTLAVVDDLLGIIVIAIFFTSELHIGILLLALVPIGLFAVLVQRRIRSPWLLLPLAAIAWALVHASGVHATVAGVLLGFTVPVIARNPEAKRGLAEHFEHLVRPISAGIAVPIFAFFAAGVSLGGWSGITGAFRDPITLGIILGLVVGKTVGITGSTWLLARFTRASLDDDLAWTDVIGMAMLAGIGFTVSLLIGELAFGSDPSAHDHMKVGVLFGSVLAALLATVVLRARNRVYRRIEQLETIDANKDGVPDVFEDDQGRDR